MNSMKALLMLSLFLGATAIAQEESTEKNGFFDWQDKKKWRLNAAGAFSAGLLTENTVSLYIHGYAGFLQERIEMRGDIFYLINQYGDRPRFDMNHQLFAGAFYHFSDKNLQPYVGLQPGLALSRSNEYMTIDPGTGLARAKIAVNPLASGTLGVKYYADRFFYCFFETRYVMGKHKADTYPVHLDEWRFAFGLGYFL
jgi:hypothetical protein